MYLRAGGHPAAGRAVLSRRQRLSAELKLVDQALRRGVRQERLLTDMVLQRRYPERRGAPPRPGEVELWREWLAIRDQIVRPALRVTRPAARLRRRPRRLQAARLVS